MSDTKIVMWWMVLVLAFLALFYQFVWFAFHPYWWWDFYIWGAEGASIIWMVTLSALTKRRIQNHRERLMIEIARSTELASALNEARMGNGR